MKTLSLILEDIQDTFVAKAELLTPFYNENFIKVGNQNTALFRIPISNIARGSKIHSSTLRFYIEEAVNKLNGTVKIINQEDLLIEEATWISHRNGSKWEIAGGDFLESEKVSFFTGNYRETILNNIPVGYWRLNESSGTSAADSSGNSYTGTYQNTPSLSQTGALAGDSDTSVSFSSASSERITFGSFPTLVPTGTGKTYTLEAWVKPASIPSDRGIVGYGGYTTGTTNALKLTTSGIMHYWVGGAGYDLTASIAISDLTDGEFHHVVATYDGVSRKIFLDGKVVASDIPTVSPNFTATAFTIGTTNSTEYFEGSLDEVVVYDYALPSSEVLNHYNIGISSNIDIDIKEITNRVVSEGQCDLLIGILWDYGNTTSSVKFSSASSSTFSRRPLLTIEYDEADILSSTQYSRVVGSWAGSSEDNLPFTLGPTHMKLGSGKATATEDRRALTDLKTEAEEIKIKFKGVSEDTSQLMSVFTQKASGDGLTDLLADVILGQKDFTQIVPYHPLTGIMLQNPCGCVIDTSVTPNLLYVADTGHNRVLVYEWDPTDISAVSDPIRVLGQEDETGGGANFDSGFSTFPTKPDASASSLAFCKFEILSPSESGGGTQIALDSEGGLWLCDFENHRVLHYRRGETVADKVIGQDNYTDKSANKGSTVTASSLFFSWQDLNSFAAGVCVAPDGIWIADSGNRRVLHFLTGSSTADIVLGQSDFTSSSSGTGLNQLKTPTSVAYSTATSSLYVTDPANDRVLKYTAPFSTGMSGTSFGEVYPGMINQFSGLKAYWRMGESSGNLSDSSGNSNTMVANGTATYSVTGALTNNANTAITLNGNSANYFEAVNSSSLNVGDTFTISAWIKKAVNGTYMGIIGRGTSEYLLRMTDSNTLQLVKSGVSVIVSSTTTITDTNWHHVAATKSGSTVKLYIDASDVTGTVTNATIVANGGVTRIGGNPQDTVNGPWNGSLDEITLWDTALSSLNITAIKNAGIYNWDKPMTVALDPTEPDRIWVTDTIAAYIHLVEESDGTLVANRSLGGGSQNVIGGNEGSGGSLGFDSLGNVFITVQRGENSHQVLCFTKGGSVTTPTRLFPWDSGRLSGISSKGFNAIYGVAWAKDQLIVADEGRILFWNDAPRSLSNGKAADGYLSGLATSGVSVSPFTRDGVLAFSITCDSDGNYLWAAGGNLGQTNKILRYTLPLTSGQQPSQVITGAINLLGGGTADILSPYNWGVAANSDSSELWITQEESHRAARIRTPVTAPTIDVILGQANSTDVQPNRGGSAAANTMKNPGSITLDKSGNLYVADDALEADGNYRLLIFEQATIPSNNAVIQYGPSADKIYSSVNVFQAAISSNGEMVIGYNSYGPAPTVEGYIGFVPGVYLDPLGSGTAANAYFGNFYSMAIGSVFDDYDNLYIADHNRNSVRVYYQPLTTGGFNLADVKTMTEVGIFRNDEISIQTTEMRDFNNAESSSYYKETLLDHPVSYYRLGELTGTIAVDEIGYSHGTYTNTPTLNSASALTGDTNPSVTFDATTSEYVAGETSKHEFSGFSPFSIEAWVYPTSTSSRRGIATNTDGAGTPSGWNFFLNHTAASTLTVNIERRNSSTTDILTSATTISTNTLSHVVGTYDGSIFRIFINGIEISTTAGSSVFIPEDTSTGWSIGRDFSGSFNYFHGRLDEVSIYDYVLTPNRILAKYNLGVNGSSVVSTIASDKFNGQSSASTTGNPCIITTDPEVNVGSISKETGKLTLRFKTISNPIYMQVYLGKDRENYFYWEFDANDITFSNNSWVKQTLNFSESNITGTVSLDIFNFLEVIAVFSSSSTLKINDFRIVEPSTEEIMVARGEITEFISVVPSGNEITDETRKDSFMGDGLRSDSSYGIWKSSTNLLINGSFDTNTNGWTISESGTSIIEKTHTTDFIKVSILSVRTKAHSTDCIISV